MKDLVDLRPDSHGVKSVPYNLPAKALLSLVCFCSSDPPSPTAPKAKINFCNSPTFMAETPLKNETRYWEIQTIVAIVNILSSSMQGVGSTQKVS